MGLQIELRYKRNFDINEFDIAGLCCTSNLNRMFNILLPIFKIASKPIVHGSTYPIVINLLNSTYLMVHSVEDFSEIVKNTNSSSSSLPVEWEPRETKTLTVLCRGQSKTRHFVPDPITNSYITLINWPAKTQRATTSGRPILKCGTLTPLLRKIKY